MFSRRKPTCIFEAVHLSVKGRAEIHLLAGESYRLKERIVTWDLDERGIIDNRPRLRERGCITGNVVALNTWDMTVDS